MWRSREPRFDVACAISQGARDYQEDAITSDFLVGADAGFVVLADGMGGHAAGELSSKIVLTEVYSDLKFQYANLDAFEADVPSVLKQITNSANEHLSEYVEQYPETHGMGSTLVVPIILENRMYWISVGDSPLYMLRQGELKQLNEDHSMAPQIDLMVKAGVIDAETAADHPDRNCLTSAMMGAHIPLIDCPSEHMELKVGDIIVCSSDGLQFLSHRKIQRILTKTRRKRATEIAEVLLEALMELDDPDQDNIAFCIIKVNDATATPLDVRMKRQAKVNRALDVKPIAEVRAIAPKNTVAELRPAAKGAAGTSKAKMASSDSKAKKASNSKTGPKFQKVTSVIEVLDVKTNNKANEANTRKAANSSK